MEKPFALIVEDDRDIVALFRHVLDMAGYQTEIVLDGKAAVEYLAISTPDIVLLDLGLPGISGGEILAIMGADQRLKKVPVVVITAHAHLIESLTVKPQLVLIKPVNIEQMTSLILQICPADKSMNSLPWDVVTGVYSHSFFVARLNYALERIKQFPQKKFAVLCLDLGHSAKLDFLFGGEYNNRVLKESAILLKTMLRPTDTIARLGEGLFAVLIEDIGGPEMLIRIASRVQGRIRKNLAKLENELQIRANVGMVLCGAEMTSVEEIMHEAEEALALAKSDRKKMLQLLRSTSFDSARDMNLASPVMR